MKTDANEHINPTMSLDFVEGTPQIVPDTFSLTKREHTAIQLAAGMWSNPAILQHCRGNVELMSTLIPAEAVKC